VALLDTLAKTNRDHVTEVETLVRELRRITLLWDEAWLGRDAKSESGVRSPESRSPCFWGAWSPKSGVPKFSGLQGTPDSDIKLKISNGFNHLTFGKT
jgi:hypothetical protein